MLLARTSNKIVSQCTINNCFSCNQLSEMKLFKWNSQHSHPKWIIIYSILINRADKLTNLTDDYYIGCFISLKCWNFSFLDIGQ